MVLGSKRVSRHAATTLSAETSRSAMKSWKSVFAWRNLNSGYDNSRAINSARFLSDESTRERNGLIN